jgi:hypothetical protein
MEANFSFHAFERVIGRLSMTHKELADLLNDDVVINIGQEPNSNRAHKLFYSIRDKVCFVAIQDIKTGTVVTVLPIDYHENISWSVSIEAQNQAKGLVVKAEVVTLAPEALNTNATVFKISGNITDYYGRYKKTVNLGSWPCAPYECSVDALVEDNKFVDFLVDKIKEKSSSLSDSQSFIQMIAIRIGNKGSPVFFSTSEILALNA